MAAQNDKNSRKRKKLMMIIVAADLILVAGGILAFLLLYEREETPERVAELFLDAAVSKDWKSVIRQTPDEVLEMVMNVDSELVDKKGITTKGAFRGWLLEHSDISDPMNGKGIQNYRITDVKTISPSEYINNYLGGEGDNAYYSFLKSKEEIAVAEISYVMLDGDQMIDRTDAVIEYRKEGKWYPLSGAEVIDTILRNND